MTAILRAVSPLTLPLWGLLLGGLIVAPAAAQPAPPGVETHADRDRQAVRAQVQEAVERFRTALETGDSSAVVNLLHPEVRVYESGHAETLEEYRSGHLAADIEFQEAVESETRHEELVPGTEQVLYLREYTVRGTFRGREIESRGTETLVLVPTDDGWRIRHIHWSSG